MRRSILFVALLVGCSRGETRAVREEAPPAPPPAEAATPAAPASESALDRRKRCLSYTAERQTHGEARTVRVRVRNACDMTVPPEESEFDITAMPSDGLGVVSHATGRFAVPIGPNSDNVETTVEVDCPGDVHAGCKYYVEPM